MNRNRAYKKTIKMQKRNEKKQLRESVNCIKRHIQDAINHGKTWISWDKWNDDGDTALTYEEAKNYFESRGYTVTCKQMDYADHIKISWDGDDNDR